MGHFIDRMDMGMGHGIIIIDRIKSVWEQDGAVGKTPGAE
jgi:hypothetical protein